MATSVLRHRALWTTPEGPSPGGRRVGEEVKGEWEA